jgi:uncharacterized protein YqgC (DUF456 family)
MDTVLIILGLCLMLLGIAGSFLPILPGPLTSWLGLLVLSFTKSVAVDSGLLISTFVLALLIFLLDFVIPALGAKRYGGSRYGMIGTTLGLIVGLVSPIPLGIIIGPFVGALIGEILHQNDSKQALRAAYGSFMGFLSSTFIKMFVAIVYLGLYIWLLI